MIQNAVPLFQCSPKAIVFKWKVFRRKMRHLEKLGSIHEDLASFRKAGMPV